MSLFLMNRLGSGAQRLVSITLRKRSGPGGDRWFLDEMTVSIQGKRQYLW